MVPSHPRIEQLAAFYDSAGTVCSFMQSANTRFALVPDAYRDSDVSDAILQWGDSGSPRALTYVWETDPPTSQAERESAIGLFGTLLRILYAADTGKIILASDLEESLAKAFSERAPGHPFLSKAGVPFYAIAMGPAYASRYAPCFSMVLTRVSDVYAVAERPRQIIRAEAERRHGGPYDAQGLFIDPK